MKFDDLAKTATDVLSENYQTKGFSTKAKQVTGWNGSVATTSINFWEGKGGVHTPATLSWKFPQPFGIRGLVIDKLEMDKAGRYKFEASSTCCLHTVKDLKVEVKSDLVDFSQAKAAVVYTGIKDTQIKAETQPLSFQDFNLEVTRAFNQVTAGIKCSQANLTTPDVGLRVDQGPGMFVVLAKQNFSSFSAHACCDARSDIKVACSVETPKKGSSSASWGVGVAYKMNAATLCKAKVEQGFNISGTVKHDLAKGFTIIAGGAWNMDKADGSFGLQLSIE